MVHLHLYLHVDYGIIIHSELEIDEVDRQLWIRTIILHTIGLQSKNFIFGELNFIEIQAQVF